jgi:WD40-like Beta Propeller Repeat
MGSTYRAGSRLAAGAGVLAIIAGLAGATSARADFIAAYDTVSATGGQDVAVVNLTTGAQVQLPAGINTPAPELHPSLSPDGRFLAFERIVPVQAGPDGPLVEQKQPFIYNLATRGERHTERPERPAQRPG